jgi:putative oxidoreductase
MLFQGLDKYRDAGLLFLRVGIGMMFMIHGYPKLSGGPESWEALGGALSELGINFMPTTFGFMAATSEFFGGLLLALGLLTRPACFFLFSTMAMATAMHISKEDPFRIYSHALEAGILFLSLMLIGPGRYSLDEKLFHHKDYSQVWKPTLKLSK